MSRGKVAVFTNQPGASRYLVKILDNAEKIAAHVQPGRVAVLDVYHNDGCALLAGAGPCDCNPTMQIRREAKR